MLENNGEIPRFTSRKCKSFATFTITNILNNN